MDECSWCRNRSLFLKVNEAGMCEKCWDDYLNKGTGKYGFTLREKLIITEAFTETENLFLGTRPSMQGFFFALETDTLTRTDIIDLIEYFHKLVEIELPEDLPRFIIDEKNNTLNIVKTAIMILLTKIQ